MKYRLNRKVCLLAFVVLTQSIFWVAEGQNDNSNHRKYWYYKSRLNNDFLKVGLGPGESIPCQRRGDSRSAFLESNPNINNTCRLAWGDATSYLGYYIAILATEFKLLDYNGQDTRKIKHELFCALNAVNRLDYIAETFFNAPANLNGYFVRDDISENFLNQNQNYEHFNYYNFGSLSANNSDSRGFMSDVMAGANTLESNMTLWNTFTLTASGGTNNISPGNPISEMSQDQAISLLYGLTFVRKFLTISETDNGAIFSYGSGETSLWKEAGNIADRIVKHIRESKHINGNSCLANISTGWHIKNPVNCNPVGFNKPVQFGLGFGDDAEFFSYAIAEAGEVIKNLNFGQGPNISLTPNYPTKGAVLYYNTPYHNLFSSQIGDDLWQGLTTVPLPGNGDNRLHVVNMSAICNCVYGKVEDVLGSWLENITEKVPILSPLKVIIGWIWKIVSTVIHYFVQTPGFYFNETSTTIGINAYTGNSDFDHAPLSRKILHGGIYLSNPDNTVGYLVDVAPCDNIYYFPSESPAYAQAEWSATDRIEHPRQRLGGLGDNNVFHPSGEYPALDFLLYHNLWYIHQMQQNNNSLFVDLSDIYINKNGGSLTQVPNFDAYETIVAEKTIFNQQSTSSYMRAGKTIYFGPGAEIHPGSSSGAVHAYIQGYACAGNSGAYRSSDGPQEDISYPSEPYHYIDHNHNSTVDPPLNDPNKDQNYVTELPIEEEIITTDKITIKAGEFKVYPNPTTNTTKMYFTLENGQSAFVTVTDLVGKIVLEKKELTNKNNGNEIDLTNLAPGSYLILYTNNDGVTKSIKLIKTN